MLLYKGTTLSQAQSYLPKIELDCRTNNLYYGRGFYTLTKKEIAVLVAQNFAFKRHDRAVVNTYYLDDEVFKKCSIMEFKELTESWLDFVVGKRDDSSHPKILDAVESFVIDDDMMQNVIYFENQVFTKPQIMNRLRTCKILKTYKQIVLKSDKILNYLKLVESELV